MLEFICNEFICIEIICIEFIYINLHRNNPVLL